MPESFTTRAHFAVSVVMKRPKSRMYLPGTRRPFGVLEWPALLKKLDKIDPSFRE